ncbi:hypothetical protein HYT84_01470 [Candidatus Micrarchaeota archaeon]|nr:hypothetical protein [Candidatus Micrarchaeota archaeon]
MDKSEIESIKERNLRVEADKAWETSKTRRVILAVATYLIAAFFLIMINAPNPLINALIPAIAFLVQMPTLSFLKGWWLKNIHKK